MQIEPTYSGKVKDAYIKHGNVLSTREKEIVTKYYGIGGETRHTLKELGAMYQVSRERIRQIKTSSLRKINADVF